MRIVLALAAVLLLVGIQFWAADGVGPGRPLLAVGGTALAACGVAAAMGMPPEGVVMLFVAALVGMTIVVAPSVWAIRGGFGPLQDYLLGASITLLTCATAAVGFATGGLIVLFTIGFAMRKCC